MSEHLFMHYFQHVMLVTVPYSMVQWLATITGLKPGRVICVNRITFCPGDPVYKISGSDPGSALDHVVKVISVSHVVCMETVLVISFIMYWLILLVIL